MIILIVLFIVIGMAFGIWLECYSIDQKSKRIKHNFQKED